MTTLQGKFIVIDGVDGSGKTTQLELLSKRLQSLSLDLSLADFPQYNTKSAGLVEEYLSGKYGGADEISPYTASLFYALDRFDASFKLKKDLSSGKTLLSNRYTPSSLAHQGGKLANSLERRAFFHWLEDLEYGMLGIPKPDQVIILHLDPLISFKLAKERQREDWKGKKKDIHEGNLSHLSKAAKIYEDLANFFPNYHIINCAPQGELLSREKINNLIWQKLEKLYPLSFIKEQKESKQKSKLVAGFHSLSSVLEKSKNFSVDYLKFREEEELKEGPEHGLNKLEFENEPNKNVEPIENAKLGKSKKLLVKRLDPRAKLPIKAHLSDAGYDIFSLENLSLPPYAQASISTGISIALPKDHVALVWDKSGLAQQGLRTMGGVIDSAYRGEIRIIIKNLGEDIYHIRFGQKIAQLLIQKIEQVELSETDFSKESERGESGFGSSGLF